MSSLWRLGHVVPPCIKEEADCEFSASGPVNQQSRGLKGGIGTGARRTLPGPSNLPRGSTPSSSDVKEGYPCFSWISIDRNERKVKESRTDMVLSPRHLQGEPVVFRWSTNTSIFRDAR